MARENKINNELQPYFSRANELTVEKGILMWGYRIVIPAALRERILNHLHSAHSGVVRMKSMALLQKELE